MAREDERSAGRGAQNEWTKPHEHNDGAAGAPGASAPGEAGYEGEVQVSAMGADVEQSPGAYADPTGREDAADESLHGDQVPIVTRQAWERAERGEGKPRPEG